ncbi:hypothetical protein M7I_5345 [Glarea lozoyensis 74030]|uniref:BZIP domain-containing protein n=1 Tax=Glarea lozoyensis (strain ATCC 74030 / MF5533) TaxID=1104152 RepID=H0ERM5_GLAL7|nr:hypothetical protein M7I_5345 [Glarea lozoyensis 74030]
MDSSADKEERKREYNRLAQREFRRRRKEHLKNLEQAQKEQSTEQSEEIERLRYMNDELRRENEALRAQVYGSSSSSHAMLSAPIMAPHDGHFFIWGRESTVFDGFRYDAYGRSIFNLIDDELEHASILRPLCVVISTILYGTSIRAPS